MNETIENRTFSTGWMKCFRCGLTAPEMIGQPPRCASINRCDHVKKGEGFGGPDWTGRAPYLPELTAQDDLEIRKAVVEFHRRLSAEAEVV